MAKNEPLEKDIDKALRDWYQETVPAVAAKLAEAGGGGGGGGEKKGGGKKKK